MLRLNMLRRRLRAHLGFSNKKTEYYLQSPNCQIADLAFLFSKFLGNREYGCFVDVGAYDGISFSNTWGLSQRNWMGTLIEPVPQFANQCKKLYKNNKNIKVIESAVGKCDAEFIELFLAESLSTGNKELFFEYKSIDWSKALLSNMKIKVESHCIANILEKENIPYDFDLISIDVEGYEAQILACPEFKKWRPKMIIIELVDTHPDLVSTADTDATLLQVIQANNYQIVYKDRLNTVFIRNDVWKKSYKSGFES